jgi:hypothetical protein
MDIGLEYYYQIIGLSITTVGEAAPFFFIRHLKIFLTSQQ